MSERTTEWAFTLFRPILKKLKVQKLTKEPHRVILSEYKKLIVARMERWVIIARRSSFADGTKGLAEIIYYESRNLFVLMIFVDESLYENDELELRTQRKMVAIHEFVHGISHMCLASYLRTEQYIELMNKSIIAKMKRTTSDEFNEMISAIGKLGTKDGTNYEIFTDDHYRLLEKNYSDGYNGNYAELFRELMLSYQLVSETIKVFKLQPEGASTSLQIF